MLPASGAWALNDVMTERAAAELFTDQGIFHAVEPHPSEILRDVGAQSPRCLTFWRIALSGWHELRERLRQEGGLERNRLRGRSSSRTRRQDVLALIGVSRNPSEVPR